MKKMLVLAFAGCVAAGAAEVNFIKDGDFEKIDAKGKGSAWLVHAASVTASPAGVSGKALRATTAKVGKMWKVGMQQKVVVKPGKYILSGQVKGDCYAVYAVLRYAAPGMKAFTAWLEQNKFAAPGASRFRRFAVPVTVPEKASAATLYIEGFSKKDSGTIEFDDFKLIPQQD